MRGSKGREVEEVGKEGNKCRGSKVVRVYRGEGLRRLRVGKYKKRGE